MNIQDDHGISNLLVGTERRLCTGFGFTEGPVWDTKHHCLYFSDIPSDTIHRWKEGEGHAVFRSPSGKSNGLALDGVEIGRAHV